MKETVLATTGQEMTATYLHGTKHIDAVSAMHDGDVLKACDMPIGFGVVDHRAFLIDFSTSSLVGQMPQPDGLWQED